MFTFFLLDLYSSHKSLNEIIKKDTWGKAAIKSVKWIEENTNKDDIIGTWAAGQIGYYSNRRIVNLEGLVGNNEVLKKNIENNLIEYIKNKNIRYIIQWFPNSKFDEKINTLKPTDNVLQNIRARVIYENKSDFKFIKKIILKDKLRHYSIFIFKVLK